MIVIRLPDSADFIIHLARKPDDRMNGSVRRFMAMRSVILNAIDAILITCALILKLPNAVLPFVARVVSLANRGARFRLAMALPDSATCACPRFRLLDHLLR